MPRPTYTPGIGGYALILPLSFLVFAALVGVSHWSLQGFVIVLVLGAWYGLGMATVPVLVGCLLCLHLVARHQPEQRLHVIAAGVIGFVAGLSPLLVDGGPGVLLFATGVAVALAVARAAVIPLVRRG